MIDPLETVIAYLRQRTEVYAVVGNRVAAQHQYGNVWEKTQAGLILLADTGWPDWDVAVQPLRLESRAYAPTQQEAMGVWRVLVQVSRSTERAIVNTTTGSALLYYFLPDSGPSLLYDDVVGLPMVMCFWRIMVADEALS